MLPKILAHRRPLYSKTVGMKFQLQYNSPGVNFCYFYAYVICKCYFHQNIVGISYLNFGAVVVAAAGDLRNWPVPPWCLLFTVIVYIYFLSI